MLSLHTIMANRLREDWRGKAVSGSMGNTETLDKRCVRDQLTGSGSLVTTPYSITRLKLQLNTI